jgi:hypothetical protein
MKDWKLMMDGCGFSLRVRTIFISLHLSGQVSVRAHRVRRNYSQCLDAFGRGVGRFLVLFAGVCRRRFGAVHELDGELGPSRAILLWFGAAQPHAAPVPGADLDEAGMRRALHVRQKLGTHLLDKLEFVAEDVVRDGEDVAGSVGLHGACVRRPRGAGKLEVHRRRAEGGEDERAAV